MNVKPGDRAKIIKSTDNLCVGKIVTVISLTGTHSKLGAVWRCGGENLITEYGGFGDRCDVPDDWLERIDPDDQRELDVKQLELTE